MRSTRDRTARGFDMDEIAASPPVAANSTGDRDGVIA
jgi:hypothetical protein